MQHELPLLVLLGQVGDEPSHPAEVLPGPVDRPGPAQPDPLVQRLGRLGPGLAGDDLERAVGERHLRAPRDAGDVQGPAAPGRGDAVAEPAVDRGLGRDQHAGHLPGAAGADDLLAHPAAQQAATTVRRQDGDAADGVDAHDATARQREPGVEGAEGGDHLVVVDPDGDPVVAGAVAPPGDVGVGRLVAEEGRGRGGRPGADHRLVVAVERDEWHLRAHRTVSDHACSCGRGGRASGRCPAGWAAARRRWT